jgi:acyl-CoA reductase-like NAD-dependent aldehyde dehydrogenase
MKVGPGTGEGVTIGPLINDKALAKVEKLVAEAVGQGAKAAVGGARHALGGLFYQPTVLTGATADMRLFQEEIFGPVAPIVKFETEADAIALANATPFGLAAYFYSRDVGRCWRVAEAIEAGMVGINEGLISTEVAPFGGVKESGLGREGSSEGSMSIWRRSTCALAGWDDAFLRHLFNAVIGGDIGMIAELTPTFSGLMQAERAASPPNIRAPSPWPRPPPASGAAGRRCTG